MSTPKLTVFFDGGCPLCSREIDHYRKLEGADRLVWLDITDPAIDLQPYGIDRRSALKSFHVMDDQGQFHLGADGFLALWDALPRYRGLAWFCHLMRLPPLMRFVYRHFAARHFRRRCQDGACALE